MLENGDFSKFVKNCEMLKMLVKTLENILSLIFFYTLNIRNIIVNPKVYQHFLPSLIITFTRINSIVSEICQFITFHHLKQKHCTGIFEF